MISEQINVLLIVGLANFLSARRLVHRMIISLSLSLSGVAFYLAPSLNRGTRPLDFQVRSLSSPRRHPGPSLEALESLSCSVARFHLLAAL